MKNFLLAFLVLPILGWAQGLYNNGAKIIVASSGNIVISSGNFTNANNGLVDLDGKIYLTGNFTNNATNHVFTNVGTNGEVIFNGSGTQTINAPISNYVDFEKVTVNTNSNVVLPAGDGMTINGVFTVNGTFTSETPNNEDIGGSLIASPTEGVAGTGTVNIKRFFKVDGRWQYVGVPMTGQPSSIFTENTTSGNFNPNLYAYDETYNANPDPTNTNYSNFQDANLNYNQAWWNGQVQSTAGSPVNLTPAVGYITYNEGNITATFTGAPDKLNDSAAYHPHLTFSANDGNSDYYDGWNLISNPYQSAIDWDDIARTKVSNAVYLWDGDNGNYVYYSATDDTIRFGNQTLNKDNNARYIPPMQSFFVKATALNPSITIPASARVHHSSQMYKNEDKEVIDYDYLKLQIENENNHFDQTVVRMAEDESISESFDNYDVYKAYAVYTDVPQIYSLVSDGSTIVPVAINSLPVSSDEEMKTIPLGVVAKADGIYTFSVIGLNNADFDKIYLKDANNPDNPVYIDLNLTSEYQTFIPKGETRDRFSLVFAKSTTDIENSNIPQSNATAIYTANKILYVNMMNQDNAKVLVYNTLGQNVGTFDAFKGLNQYDVNHLPIGQYTVKLTNNNYTKVQKIVLQYKKIIPVKL